MKRRTFLQGVAATFAAILAPFRAKAAESVRATGYLRVVAPSTYKWLSGDLDPNTKYGSFNLFLNTPYFERMSPAFYADTTAMEKAIIKDRQATSLVLGPDRRNCNVPLSMVVDGTSRNGYVRQHILRAMWEVRGTQPPIGA